MEARLEEDREVLSARGQIRYQNESPDTLTEFYFHLYLNAFRPNSAWARHDLERGVRTFQDLGPKEHGFERVEGMRVDGSPAPVSYPYAPDSTILRVELPRALPPGGAITLDFDWEARPSSLPRRQGRRGRHYDFAQWYPRVVAYDLEGWADHPLYRAGEFYGDFATYDVSFELQDDQVMAATGVPVEGDPGWEGAAAPGTPAIEYRREFYGPVGGPPCRRGPLGETSCGIPAQEEGPPTAQSLGLLDPEAPQGWKQVRFYARDVHHFAWSTSPDYIYEHGDYRGTAIHVLYQPGDEESWGGVAVERTATALEWLEWVFGPYLYPQVTNLHRIEGGGTEFPMMVMDGSANLGLIVHEVGHIYAMGMLANNEWRDGWLDEGLTSFQTSWLQERVMPGADVWTGSEMRVLDLDLRGRSEPVVQPAEYYSSQGVYSTMIYTKASLIFRMLRDMVGDDAFRRVLNTYFQRYHFSHVDQEAFQEVAEEVLRMELDWFFGQWLHATGTVDYGLGKVDVTEDAPGEFRTRVTLDRNGEMRMPVPLRLRGRSGEVQDTVVPGWGRAEDHVILTPWRPARVQIDPEGTILDWNGLNDHWPRRPWGNPGVVRSLDDPFRPAPLSRDQLICSFFPLAWFNDAGGVTLGLQRRGNYMGSMKRALVRIGFPAFEAGDKGGGAERTDYGSVYFRIQDPIVFGRPWFGADLELFAGEGRALARGEYEWDLSPRPGTGSQRFVRAFSMVASVFDDTYLRAGRWASPDHTLGEWGLGLRGAGGSRDTRWNWDLSGAGGVTSLDHRYLRGSVELGLTRSLPANGRLELRTVAAGAMGRDPETGEWETEAVPLERRSFLGGAGPFEALRNPFLRSAGAPLDEVGYVPGGAGLRGMDPSWSNGGFVALNLDLASREFGIGPLGLRARMFTDWAFTPGLETSEVDLDLVSIQEHQVVGNAGVGLELGWSRSPIRLRVDLPLFVTDPVLAVTETREQAGFRARVWIAGY